MGRTISRKSKMDQRIVLRATVEDVANLKIAAQEQGKDPSAFLRDILIREKVIKPM